MDRVPQQVHEWCLVEQPYLKRRKSLTLYCYNPNYGDSKVCSCGHPYYRHFDTYEQMEAVGCKYCQCLKFKEPRTPVE